MTVRRILLILSAAILVLISAHGLPRGSQRQQQHKLQLLLPTHKQQQPQVEGGRKRVNFFAKSMRSVPGMPDSVMRLVDNVVFYHNGAVLTCDSAYKFGDKRIECYGRVLINKDSTFIYGDRALYDGYENTAQVFAPLIKVVDGDAILYTFNFSFNTLDNIGRYWGRGTITQKENRLESMRGYYYADTREFVSVEEVEATDPEYKLATDSVRYNMDSETADFFTPTVIWNVGGEIIGASRGTYRVPDAWYDFTRDTYILTETREVFCDSLEYDSRPGNAVMMNNIQIRDDDQKVMAFGDYGQYWGEREDAMMTRNPSAFSFDSEQDTTYIRSDTMLLRSIGYDLDYSTYDSLRRAGAIGVQVVTHGTATDTLSVPPLPDLPPRHEREGVWPDPEPSGMREALREMVVAQKSALFSQGGAFTRESLTPEIIDSLLNTGYSSEDIEGQLRYNERKRELEAQGLSITDSVVYEILESIGAFGNPLPPTEQEIILDSLKKLESETHGKLLEELGRGTAVVDSALESETRGKLGESGRDTAVIDSASVSAADTLTSISTDTLTVISTGDDDKLLSRRDRRRLERERETTDKQVVKTTDKDNIGKGSTGADTATGTGTVSNAAASLRSVLEGFGVDMDVLLQEIREKGMSALPDELAVQLQALGIDPRMLVPQGIILPVDSLSQTTLPSVHMAADTLTGAARDALAGAVQDSLAAAEPPKHDSLQRVMFAYRNVRIFRNDMQAVCDSLVVLSKDSTVHLHIDPIIWNKQNQITAQIIDIYTKNQQPEHAVFTGWPMMVSEVDSTKFRQIKGREMESFFRDNEIVRHVTTGNAQTLYYLTDDDSNEAWGLWVVKSSSITFLFEDQQIKHISWHIDSDGVLHPIEKIPLDLNRFLDGFRWEIERKPSLKDVFDRIVRPSLREHYESLPQPVFPITDFIEQEKKRLAESGVWEDRVDTLPPHAIDFLRSIGVAR